mgnify:CR=1 FL=1
MKLLDAVKGLEPNDTITIENIIECLNERKETIECSEPFNYGSYYDKWEEKLSDLQDIIEQAEELLKISVDNREDKIAIIRRDIIFHQFTYGGLKRLSI